MPTMAWPRMPTVPFGPTVLGYPPSAYESESICTAAGSMHDVKNLITTSHAVRMKAKVFVQQPGLCMTVKIYHDVMTNASAKDFQNGGPIWANRSRLSPIRLFRGFHH